MVESEEVEVPNGSQEQPIKVDEDHDIPQSGIGREVEDIVRRVQKGDARFNPIDLDGEDESLSEDPWRVDEDNYDNDNAKIEREELATEPEDIQDGPCVHWKRGIRNPCPCGTHYRVSKATIGGVELGKFQVVELEEPVRVGRYEAEFIEIHEIWTPYKGQQSFIRGRAYARTRNLEGRIEPRKNELCEMYELDANDHRATDPVAYLEQALVEVSVQNIKTARTLHKTNKAFPECRFDPIRYRTKEEREDEAPLTCRWQMVMLYPDHRYRRQQRPIDGEEVRHYSHDDIPKDRHRVPDSERRQAHGKIRGGSFVPNGTLEADPGVSEIHLAPGQKYTVVDVFSGAGGYSTGAKMAGLKILAACDHWPRCCETYRQNFPDAELHQEDVYKYIEELKTDLTRDHPKVDILHFSPPCQTWSPAHTCEGKKDEANRATLFACEKIITIFHPRIFTVEQTFGLAQERWIPSFNALLQGFTRHGYSVKWKVMHLVEFGLPQTRKRLVMMGAAPGEQLPAWPAPTHSRDPRVGQRPLVSAARACSDLVEGENLHDVEGARRADKIPWDGSKPLERTITTSGGQCYHWSGERELTLAEFAALQGFPSFFRFVGKCIKRQIGNAFPPVVVKALLKSIRVHLEKFDGVVRQPAPGQTIIVSDDDDSDKDDDNNRPQPGPKNHSPSNMDNATPYRSPTTAQEIEQAVEAANNSTISPRLSKALRFTQIGEHGSGPGVVAPRQAARTSQISLFNGAVDSEARKTGIRAALVTVVHENQADEGAAGPTHRRSGSGSVIYVGEAARAGASRSLPIVLEVEEGDHDERRNESGCGEEGGGDVDADEQLQRAIRMSMADVSPTTQDGREEEEGEADVHGFDPREVALAVERSMQDARRLGQDYEQEDLHSAMDGVACPEREMYGPGDYKGKGKGKEVARRCFDEYVEDEVAQREGGPSKRPRGYE
ncbi:hypothetical protein diail_10991 [Diaporthe ilicicola]|nr:hypothetical protein diail_10991 [Diaporthe ilicicola]